jgi:hypothetical protein
MLQSIPSVTPSGVKQDNIIYEMGERRKVSLLFDPSEEDSFCEDEYHFFLSSPVYVSFFLDFQRKIWVCVSFSGGGHKEYMFD